MAGKSTQRTISSLSIGVAFGCTLGWIIWSNPLSRSLGPTTGTLTETTDVSVDEAESLRQDDYASLNSIEAILALPGDFAESEAAFALAGRTNAATLQDLLYQAASIAKTLKRDAMIRILLARLTELDPLSAVALAEGPLNRFGVDYASVVWRAWASRDFDAALTAASVHDGNRQRIAQALFSALPTLDDSRAGDIESTLGKRPDDDVKANEIGNLYSQSEALAIGHLNATATAKDQVVISALAKLLVADHGDDAVRFLDDIADGAVRRAVRRSLVTAMAVEDPVAAIAFVQTNQWESSETASLGGAFESIAKEDPDKALALVHELSPGVRKMMEAQIVSTVAATDIDRALVLADSAIYADSDGLRRSLIRIVASSDVQRAVEIATGIEDSQAQAQAVQMMVYTVEIEAMPLIADIALKQPQSAWGGRNQLGPIGRRWAKEDPDAAMAWAQGLPDDARTGAMGQIISEIAMTAPNKAITLVDSLGGNDTDDIRRMLATSLSGMDLVPEALLLANGVADADAKRSIQLAALSQMMRSEPEQAMVLARQTADQDLQDVVFSASLNKSSRSDPVAALERVSTIQNTSIREKTESRIVSELAKTDLQAAREHVRRLPPGSRYDSLAAGLSISAGLTTNEALALTGSIQNKRTRQRAELQLLYRTSFNDQEAGRKLAERLDMEATDREQFETMMLQRGVRYW